jgi:hypothetical protein
MKQLTPCWRLPLDKLIVAQLTNKFPAIYHYLVYNGRHVFLHWATRTQPHLIIYSPSTYALVLHVGLSLIFSYQKFPCIYFPAPVCHTPRSSLSPLFYNLTNIGRGEKNHEVYLAVFCSLLLCLPSQVHTCSSACSHTPSVHVLPVK